MGRLSHVHGLGDSGRQLGLFAETKKRVLKFGNPEKSKQFLILKLNEELKQSGHCGYQAEKEKHQQVRAQIHITTR